MTVASLSGMEKGGRDNDPGEVIVLFETTDVAKAKELISSADLKESMQAAGDPGPPDIVFLSEK